MQPTLSNHRSSDEAIAAFAPSDAMQVRVLRSWADLASIKDHWAAMLERSENASIFCSYEWMESWWNAWGESGHLNVLVFEVNGQMFALAPLYIESRKVTGATLEYLSMVGDNSGDSENLDFIVTPGYERECAEAFLRWLEQNPSVDICSFKAMPESSTFGEALLGLLKQREWAVEQWTSPGFYIPLPATFDEYLSRLSS